MKQLDREFYLRPTLSIAKDLVGKLFIRQTHETQLVSRIVEVEAYLGSKDPASHAYKGKTRRNEVMFGNGGHLYVYFTYGMHYCCNVVTEEEGVGHAVLLRAAEPLTGIDIMTRNRGLSVARERDKFQVCNGPAKLCQAYGITKTENGIDLCGNELWIAEETLEAHRPTIVATTRVGISQGISSKWRFCLRNNPYVSRGKPSSLS
jgi:DNA-3-methyladenine glycosylase